MKKIYILNGPPGCGKDTIAGLLSPFFREVRFKEALYDDVISFFSLSQNQAAEFMLRAVDPVLKETQWSRLQLGEKALSPRDALIHVSENVRKPLDGKSYYGKQLARSLCHFTDKQFVASDGGFPEEVKPLAAWDGGVVLVRLHRDGFEFSKDSRDYISDSHAPAGCDIMDIELIDGCPGFAVRDILEHHDAN